MITCEPHWPSGQRTQSQNYTFYLLWVRIPLQTEVLFQKNPSMHVVYAINPIILLEYSSQALFGCYVIGFIELLLITLRLFEPQKQAFLLHKCEL